MILITSAALFHSVAVIKLVTAMAIHQKNGYSDQCLEKSTKRELLLSL